MNMAAPIRQDTPVVQRPVPRLRLSAAAGAADLALAVRGAMGLLVAAGLVRLALPGERADLLHTIGDVDPEHGPVVARRIHTVDRIALRGGRELAPTRRWIHQQRRRAAESSLWLVHGRTAARLVVGAGLTAGGRVHCLPMLAPLRSPNPAWAGRRALQNRLEVRRHLAIPPGVRVVTGASPHEHGSGDWAAVVERMGRPDVRVLRLPIGDHGVTPPAELSLEELLDATDCFVAAEYGLTAVNPAVLALARGIPVVAVSTDSAAELVTAGRDGVVVAPRVGAVVDAVVAHLDGGGRRTTWHGRPEEFSSDDPFSDEHSPEALARNLLHAYGRALAAPGPSRRVQL
jgi:phosphohistidine swiveling domain-containing protein